MFTSLYLLFNEGYNSTSHSKIIRNDLVEEAVDYVFFSQKMKQPITPVMQLLSLCFHAARLESRLIRKKILLLEDKTHTMDQSLINAGIFFFEKQCIRSRTLTEPSGEAIELSLSIYHLQAAIDFNM